MTGAKNSSQFLSSMATKGGEEKKRFEESHWTWKKREKGTFPVLSLSDGAREALYCPGRLCLAKDTLDLCHAVAEIPWCS